MQGLLQRCWVLLALWLGFLCENASGQNVVGGEMTVVSGFEKPDTYHLWEFPMGMARNGSTFYAIDSINNGMQSFDIDGVGTTIFPSSAGGFADGDSASALMNGPRGMFYVESLDVFFVADANNKCVREVKFAAGWEMRTIYGGPGTNDLAWPSDVVMHTATNRMYVSSTGQHRVAMLDWHPTNPAAFFNTIGGGAQGNTDGTYAQATFHDPWGLGLDEDSNILYIADFQNHAIRWVDLNAERVYTLTSGSGHTDGDLGTALWNNPRDIYYYAPWNHIFVAEFGCSVRRIYNGAGLGSSGPVDTVLAIVRADCGIGVGTGGKCNEPSGVLFDPNSNHVLIADSRNNRIVKVPVEYTMAPTNVPTYEPTSNWPTATPTYAPTSTWPTATPTYAPTTPTWPTVSPTASPTLPTTSPTTSPTFSPTTSPTTSPPTAAAPSTASPTDSATPQPTPTPSNTPASSPTEAPSRAPTSLNSVTVGGGGSGTVSLSDGTVATVHVPPFTDENAIVVISIHPTTQQPGVHGPMVSVNLFLNGSMVERRVELTDAVILDMAVTSLHTDECSRPLCGWLNVSTQTWETTGCTASKPVGGRMNCTCTHLTDFAVLASESSVCPKPTLISYVVAIPVYSLLLLYACIVCILLLAAAETKASGHLVVQHALLFATATARLLSCLRFAGFLPSIPPALVAIISALPLVFEVWTFSGLSVTWAAVCHFPMDAGKVNKLKLVVLCINCVEAVGLVVMFVLVVVSDSSQTKTLALAATVAQSVIFLGLAVVFMLYSRSLSGTLTVSESMTSVSGKMHRMAVKVLALGHAIALLFVLQTIVSIIAVVVQERYLTLEICTAAYLLLDVGALVALILLYAKGVQGKVFQSKTTKPSKGFSQMSPSSAAELSPVG